MAGITETRSSSSYLKMPRAMARTWRSSSEPRTRRLPVPDGFEVVPTTDVELTVTESSRHGAPMTLVRGGEDRDLDAIAAMGHVRARPVPVPH